MNKDWAQHAIKSFYDNKLNLSPDAWRLVGRLRVTASKYTQVEILVDLLQVDLSTAQSILEQHQPYEALFSMELNKQEQAVTVFQELRHLEERLVLWHEDFYIHVCILLDCVAELVYWSLPREVRKGLQHKSFSSFYNSLLVSRQTQLQNILPVFESILSLYQNTLKPLRDKVIVHHRPPASSIMTHTGYKLTLVDEFRPDRLKLIEQIRASENNYSSVSNSPPDEILLLSHLVTTGNPKVNDHLDKLGVVGVQLPNPLPIWIKISEFCIRVSDSFAIIAQMYQDSQPENTEHPAS